jgi:hypothetical protein
MPNPIDEKYRLELIRYYLAEIEDKGNDMWVFYCPLCQAGRSGNKYIQKKGGMFWRPQLNAWTFNCIKCEPYSMRIFKYLKLINPELARRYQKERYPQSSKKYS